MDQVYHKFPFSPHPHPLGQGSWGSCKTPASWRKFWAVFAISSSCTWPCHCWKVTSMRPRPRETTRKKTSQPGWVPQVGNAFNGGTMGNNYAELVCWFRFFSALPDVVPQSLLVDVLRTCLTIFPEIAEAKHLWFLESPTNPCHLSFCKTHFWGRARWHEDHLLPQKRVALPALTGGLRLPTSLHGSGGGFDGGAQLWDDRLATWQPKYLGLPRLISYH